MISTGLLQHRNRPDNRITMSISNGGKPTPHICIVGAGISGLRCASELLAHGIKVTIIEARDRIGGRIHQSDELGYTVDVGPNWIHTSGQNPILDLANSTGTPLHIWNEKVQVFDHDGNTVKDETAKRLGELRWEIIEEAVRHSKENMQSIDKNDSLGDFFKQKAAEMDLSDYDKKVLVGMAEQWGCYTGDSIYRQTLKYAWLEDCCCGGEYLMAKHKNLDLLLKIILEESIVVSSYAAILAETARVPLKSANLLLGKKVVRISNEEGVAGRQSISIAIEGSEPLAFDGVVVTTPLGWLKRNESAFRPGLPSPLRAAIDSISVGNLEKVMSWSMLYYVQV